MRVIDPGHTYALDNKGTGTQELRFHKDQMQEQGTAYDGVLCQEVLRVLLDRMHYLDAQHPSHENVAIRQHLRAALILFETRAIRRTLEKLPYPDRVPVGPDGHVFALRHERREG